MPLYIFEDKKPIIGKTSFVHPDAVLIGDVRIGETCFIGAGAVLRGDWGVVIVEDGSNVQENAAIHAGPDSVTSLGKDSHVGHGAILHGCTLEGHVLVGMGAIVSDAAHVGEGAAIAAGAMVPPRMEIPPGKLVMGVPARVERDVGENMDKFIWMGTRLYQTLPERYSNTMQEVSIGECRTGQ
jgi:phenylacetic acid degradation protein